MRCRAARMGRCTTTASWSRSGSPGSCASGCCRSSTPQRRPLTVEAGPSLDELAPFAVGRRVGSAVGDDVVPLHAARCPAAWCGPARRGGDRPRLPADAPGFQCEGLVRDAQGPAGAGHPPARARPCRSTPVAGPVELVVEAASNPSFPQFRPSPLGSPDTAGDAPLYRLDRADLVVVDADAEALLHDLDVLDGVMRTLAARRPAPGAAAARARARARRRSPGRRRPRRHGGRRAAGARRRRRPADAARTASSPPATPTSTRRGCGRCRETVRKCMRTFASAVRADGRRPRVPLLVLAGPAVRVDRASASPSCSPASPTRSPPGSGSRSAACGSRPT